MKWIELVTENGKAYYNHSNRTVTHMTRNKVMMTCEVPEGWLPSRVFQFMESLLKANEVII